MAKKKQCQASGKVVLPDCAQIEVTYDGNAAVVEATGICYLCGKRVPLRSRRGTGEGWHKKYFLYNWHFTDLNMHWYIREYVHGET